MYSPEFMKFLIGHDIEEYARSAKKEEKAINLNENKIFRYTQFATIPLEIKK